MTVDRYQPHPGHQIIRCHNAKKDSWGAPGGLLPAPRLKHYVVSPLRENWSGNNIVTLRPGDKYQIYDPETGTRRRFTHGKRSKRGFPADNLH